MLYKIILSVQNYIFSLAMPQRYYGNTATCSAKMTDTYCLLAELDSIWALGNMAAYCA